MNNNIRLGQLFGIPFQVNPSWFIVLALVTWSYGQGLAADFPQLAGSLPWILGLGTALLVFGSVLAHELGHSFVARQQGIAVKSITLFLFGGIASLGEESRTPGDAFAVAIAGPAVSLVLFAALTALSLGTAGIPPLAAILGVLASVNLALGLFNLIPGLPLDGGNILKALVWKITGNPYRGIVFAGRVGQVIGWLAIASGLIPLLAFGSFGNVWNLIIGWFLLNNAGRAAQVATIEEQLNGLTAADAVTPNSPVVLDSTSLRTLADQSITTTWRKFLVTNAEGHLVGSIALEALQGIPTAEWSDRDVRSLMIPMAPATTISSQQPLIEVIRVLAERQASTLAVILDNGVLLGLLEKTSVVQLLQDDHAAPTAAA